MFEDLDDNADWFTHIQQLIRKAKTERELKLVAALLDGHHFLALPEHCQQDLVNQYADKLEQLGAD